MKKGTGTQFIFTPTDTSGWLWSKTEGREGKHADVDDNWG